MAREYSLHFLAEKLGCSYQGEGDKTVIEVADLESASADQLSFLSNKRFEAHLETTQAGIVIVKQGQTAPPHLNLLLVDDPYLAYATLSSLFERRQQQVVGIHPSAVVDPSAQIDPTAAIGANCVIEADVVIGPNSELCPGVFVGARSRLGAHCLIYPNVSLYHDTKIGDRVMIHANSVIGSDGFGYAPLNPGWKKISQLGGVSIGNDVEIGASVAIDRGAVNDTIISDGVIMDNQIHVAHNVQIGKNSAVAGCVGIAGSSKIGEGCTFGGMVGISGHIEISDNAHFNGGTSVRQSVKEPGLYSSGTLMQDAKSWRKTALRLSQIEELVGRVKKLEKALAQLQEVKSDAE